MAHLGSVAPDEGVECKCHTEPCFWVGKPAPTCPKDAGDTHMTLVCSWKFTRGGYTKCCTSNNEPHRYFHAAKLFCSRV